MYTRNHSDSYHTIGVDSIHNISSGTLNDPSPFFLTDSLLNTSSAAVKRRLRTLKKKPRKHTPRPPNAFMLFRASLIHDKSVSVNIETKHSTLSKIFGLAWRKLSDEERRIWHIKAKSVQEEHKRKYPQYTFRPVRAKDKREIRKTREVGMDDMGRCAQIAELLTQGLKGSELNAAVAEYDRNNVPKIDIRFTTPTTAGAYRRSLSSAIPGYHRSKTAPLEAPSRTPSPQRDASKRDMSSERSSPYQLQSDLPDCQTTLVPETTVSSYLPVRPLSS